MRPLRGHQDISVATLEESGVLCFPSRLGLTPRGSMEVGWQAKVTSVAGRDRKGVVR